MAKTNLKTTTPAPKTAGGGTASRISAEQELRRSVAACLLWEKAFYESGVSIAERIKALVPKVRPAFAAAVAFEARDRMNLRHVPLLVVREMARHPGHRELVAKLLPDVIQRADEITEFLALYWAEDKNAPISKQVKLGLARAFNKFNEYSLAKYNRDADIKLRDVLFLVHAKPTDEKQAELWKRLIDGGLAIPDTWETQLSAGADKKETFTRLMQEKKLGALAFIRNLRNMEQSGVDRKLIAEYAATVDTKRVLPFRYVAAQKQVPQHEDILDGMLLRTASTRRKLPGKTVLVIDVSGSMRQGQVSAKSDLSRLDAAGALAAIMRESCEDCRLYATAGSDGAYKHATMAVPPRRGFPLIEQFTHHAFTGQIGHGGIFLNQVCEWVGEKEGFEADRLIILTDEQDCDRKANPKDAKAFGKANYIINVSVEKSGIAYDKFTHINGWSEAIVDYLYEYEAASIEDQQLKVA